MAKVNANYEVVYILDPALGEEAIAAMIEKFKALVETQVPWPPSTIGQAPSGLSHQRSQRGPLRPDDLHRSPALPAELDRVLKITEGSCAP